MKLLSSQQKSPTVAATVVLMAAGAALLLASLAPVHAALTLEKCIIDSFAPPPPTDDPEAVQAARLRETICRDLGRSVYFPYRNTGRHSPEYVAALKKMGIFKNNEYALDYYLRHNHLPPPTGSD